MLFTSKLVRLFLKLKKGTLKVARWAIWLVHWSHIILHACLHSVNTTLSHVHGRHLHVHIWIITHFLHAPKGIDCQFLRF